MTRALSILTLLLVALFIAAVFAVPADQFYDAARLPMTEESK